MKKAAILLLLGLMAGQQVSANDASGVKKGGSSFEKGLQTAGQGITKGAEESGIEKGLRTAGKDIKNGAESAGKRLSELFGQKAHKSGDK